MPSTLTSALPQLPGERSIRLLRIRPSQQPDELDCETKTIENLDRAPDFDALSYVWGGPKEQTTTIRLNDAEVHVKISLAKILRHLKRSIAGDALRSVWDESHPLHASHNVWRSFSRNIQEHDSFFNPRSEWLWIDALCINQDDHRERSSQVEFMRDIYRSAKSVRIWFGEEKATAVPLSKASTGISERRHFGEFGPVPVLLVFINQALRNLDAVGEMWYGESFVNMHPRRRNFLHGFPENGVPEWDILKDFFSNAWFRRVWVIQEAAVSRKQNAVIMIGDWEIKWWAVGKASLWFERNGYCNLPTQNASATWNITTQSDERVPLLSLLSKTRERETSDGRDRVYALLGLAKETDITRPGEQIDPRLRPDYDKSQQEVFRDVAKYFIEKSNGLSILSHCKYLAEDISAGYPSWVPVWTTTKRLNVYHTNIFRCPFYSDLGQEISAHIIEGTLNVQGVCCDEVDVCIEPLGAFQSIRKLFREERDWVVSAWEVVDKTLEEKWGYSYRRGRAQHTFLTALTAGVDDSGNVAESNSVFQKSMLEWVHAYFGKRFQVPSSIQEQSLRTSYFERVYGHWKKLFTGQFEDFCRGSLELESASRFQGACARASRNRRIFVTRNGRIGLGPVEIQQGDCVVVLFGGKLPYILRQQGESYILIGDSYVSEIMNGEAVREWREDGSPEQVFEIV